MILLKNKISINKNEISGAFGDIGTDLPLIIGMLLATNLQLTNVLIVYGVLQIITAFIYGIPMPVQPLKAVALIVITQKISADVIFGGGLAIGIIMLILTVTGLIVWLGHKIPKTVIRGVQLGLGFQLAMLAVKDYIPNEQTYGYILGGIGFFIGIILIGNRKYPPALFILLIGIIYMLVFNFETLTSIQLHAPIFKSPEFTFDSMLTGLLLLALPQIPLSLSNSIYATNQLVQDYFPGKNVTVKKIGLTYSLMNIISPFVGGIPVCHGSGGIAGHYTFGGRTGGSTLIYGLFYLILGFVLSGNPVEILQAFPKSILGVILLFEGISLILLVKDIITDKKMFFIAIVVGVCAIGLPYGFFIGMVLGLLLYYMVNKPFLKHFGKL